MAEPRAAHAGSIVIGGDLPVHRFGFGAMRITGPGVFGPPPDRDGAVAVLRRAVELGITFIDTADAYGPEVSEELIAEALRPLPADVVVATKGGLVRPGPGQWVPDGRPEHLRAACEGSLRRLHLDQLPLYQFHRPDPKVPFEESVGALAALREEGKVRHVGLSNVSVAQIEAARRIVPIVSVQNRYNLEDRSAEDVLGYCGREHIAFLPWAPIQGASASPGALAVAQRRGASPLQVAIAFLLERSPVMLPIAGTSSVAHLEENLRAVELALSAEELELLA